MNHGAKCYAQTMCIYKRLVKDTFDLFFRWYRSIFSTSLNNSPLKVLTVIQGLDRITEILKIKLLIARNSKNVLEVISSLPWLTAFYHIKAHNHHFHQKLHKPLGMSTARFALLAHTIFQLWKLSLQTYFLNSVETYYDLLNCSWE